MPNPMIDSRQLAVAAEVLDGSALMSPPDQAEAVTSGAQVSLAQFATEISNALKQSGKVSMQGLEPLMDLFQVGRVTRESESGHGIAVHSGLLMQLLGEESKTAEPGSTESFRECGSFQSIPPEAPKTLSSQAATAENQPTFSLPAQANSAPAQTAVSTSANAGTALQLPMNVVIDSALRALSILKLKVSSVISVARVEEGWRVAVELVERAGVPDTSDVLGVYELRMDSAGNVLAYERTRMRRRCDLSR